MARWSLLPLALVMACAHARGDGAATPGTDRATAQRLYTVAEDRYAAEAYDEAVALMRHSLLQLPPEPEHDAQRHQLVLRMAHTQLMWFASGPARPRSRPWPPGPGLRRRRLALGWARVNTPALLR